MLHVQALSCTTTDFNIYWNLGSMKCRKSEHQKSDILDVRQQLCSTPASTNTQLTFDIIEFWKKLAKFTYTRAFISGFHTSQQNEILIEGKRFIKNKFTNFLISSRFPGIFAVDSQQILFLMWSEFKGISWLLLPWKH